MTISRGGAVLVAVLAVAGCETSGAPEVIPEEAVRADVAMVAADGALGDLGAMALTGFGPSPSPRGGPGDGPPFHRTRTVEFFDADGNEMDAYDPLRTASVHLVVEVGGERSRDDWSATVERVRDLTVSGLEGEETERLWSGTTSGLVARSRHADDLGERTHQMSEEGAIEDVVISLDREEHPWPLSGSIRRTVEVRRTGPDGGMDRTWDVVILFDGTRFPEMTVNGEPYELDLAARDGRRPFRPRGGRGG